MTTAIFHGYRLLTLDSGMCRSAFPRLTIVNV
jgi:hypothetical protein